jgi:hypothetical protein
MENMSFSRVQPGFPSRESLDSAFVGRKRKLAALGASKRARAAVLSGGLRTGKIVLASEFFAFAQTEGAKVLDALTSMRCRDVPFRVGSKFFPINRITVRLGCSANPTSPGNGRDVCCKMGDFGMVR